VLWDNWISEDLVLSYGSMAFRMEGHDVSNRVLLERGYIAIMQYDFLP